jgi:hypothetical protein
MSTSLKAFEEALLDLSREAKRITLAADGSQELCRAMDEADGIWNNLLGPLFKRGTQADSRVDVESIKGQLRTILGIEKLMQIRRWIVDQAATCVDNQ